ncbi:hypothetical protein SeMB42_g06131 [Synchytrium endobioticum]|uniref:Uncharacterized protein n=1 Tax=Synchytrium endobioticum TaxID=286115 RepID=A0A507CME9_9FUNG|nr:hypothetical protein SeMB42_g06131 [Synchytrium endobioticum]
MLLSLRPYEPRIVSSPTTKYTKHIPLSYFRHPRIRHSLPATSAPFHSYHEISSSATGSTDIIHADLRTAIRNYVHSYIQHAQLSTSAVSMNPATGYTRDPSMSRFSFDTYRLVRQLERQGFKRGQAVSLMRTINALLVDATLTIRAQMLTKTSMENQSYRMRSELQELRSELSLLRQNDTSTLRSLLDQLMRDIENLTQKFAESLATLKTEINLDMNNRKAEMRETAANTDMEIQEIHHKLSLKLAETLARPTSGSVV